MEQLRGGGPSRFSAHSVLMGAHRRRSNENSAHSLSLRDISAPTTPKGSNLSGPASLSSLCASGTWEFAQTRVCRRKVPICNGGFVPRCAAARYLADTNETVILDSGTAAKSLDVSFRDFDTD